MIKIAEDTYTGECFWDKKGNAWTILCQTVKDGKIKLTNMNGTIPVRQVILKELNTDYYKWQNAKP